MLKLRLPRRLIVAKTAAVLAMMARKQMIEIKAKTITQGKR